jgi:hypothetical protein
MPKKRVIYPIIISEEVGGNNVRRGKGKNKGNCEYNM